MFFVLNGRKGEMFNGSLFWIWNLGQCISCLKAIVGGEDREGWCVWKDKDNDWSVWLKLMQLR